MLRQVVIVFLTPTLIAASGCGSNSAVQQPPRCVSGAVAEILKGYFGTPNVNFVVSSSTVFNPAHVHTFNSTKDPEKEVGDARIYAGFHYHHSVVQGFVLGQHVAQCVLVNFFQPVASH